jgi:23S rRNA (guanosine2251-2'-O)-methyltransferase
MRQKLYFFGKNPLQEYVLARKRGYVEGDVEVYITRQAEGDPMVMSALQSASLPYKIVNKEEIDSLVTKDVVHQGVCIAVYENDLYTTLPEVLSRLKENKNTLFVLLDELQDPHNVGAIIRSAVAFGASAVLLPEHNQTHLTGTVIKSASGMNFSIPVVKITNINATLLSLKEKGFWVYALTGSGDTSLATVVFDTNVLLVVGSEGVGVHKKTLEHSDFTLSIAMEKHAESLNASNATAVTLYEWYKQNSTH